MGKGKPALHHLALGVADVARVAAFYRDVLGLGPAGDATAGGAGQAASVWLALGDGAILMIEPGPPAAPRAVVLAIERAARETWRARLAAAGHPVTDETRFTLYALDPAGNRVGLSHWPDEA